MDGSGCGGLEADTASVADDIALDGELRRAVRSGRSEGREGEEGDDGDKLCHETTLVVKVSIGRSRWRVGVKIR